MTGIDAKTQVLTTAAEWVQDQLHQAVDERADERDIQAILKYLDVHGLEALVKGASTEPAIQKSINDLDADPDQLNTPNGAIDLRTGGLHPHDPASMHTKMTGAEYHPDAEHEDWDLALESVTPEVRDFLQVRFGQAAYGEPTPTDEVLMLQGGGANGKTLITGSVMAALGGYAVLLPSEILVAGRNGHPVDFMPLRGGRLVVVEELAEGRALASKQCKILAGTPEITARNLYQAPVTFRAQHSPFINTNHLPILDEADHGTRRRFQMVPFDTRYIKSEAERVSPSDRIGDPTLKSRLRGREQQQAVLAWIVQGAVRYAEMGKTLPPPPEAVKARTREWVHEIDPLQVYIEDHLTFDPDAVISCADLLEHFNQCTGEGWKNWGAETFSQRFRGHNLVLPHKVTKSRARASQITNQPPGRLPGSRQGQVRVWRGVRWV